MIHSIGQFIGHVTGHVTGRVTGHVNHAVRPRRRRTVTASTMGAALAVALFLPPAPATAADRPSVPPLHPGLAGGGAAAAAGTVERDASRGAGFFVSWVEDGTTDVARQAGARGNAHLGYLQTFRNVDRPLFVYGEIVDLRCAPGQDPRVDDCQVLGVRTITNDDATLTVSGRLAGGWLRGQVLVSGGEGAEPSRAAVSLRVRQAGALQPHHYVDDVQSPDFTLFYEEIGRERPAVGAGRVAGSQVEGAEGTLLRFRWTLFRSTS